MGPITVNEAEAFVLRFEPLNADLLVRRHKETGHPRGIQFTVRPTDPIALSSGTSLNDHEWSIVVDEGDIYNKHAAEVGALGFMIGPFGQGRFSCVLDWLCCQSEGV